MLRVQLRPIALCGYVSLPPSHYLELRVGTDLWCDLLKLMDLSVRNAGLPVGLFASWIPLSCLLAVPVSPCPLHQACIDLSKIPLLQVWQTDPRKEQVYKLSLVDYI